MRPNFDKAELAARKLRLYQPSSRLFCDVLNASFDRPIIIDTFQHYSKVTNQDPLSDGVGANVITDGLTISVMGYDIILYDEDFPCGKEHALWTIAHEIGHIYLEHETDDTIQEIEAHWFAAEFLSPEPLIHEIVKLQSQYGYPVTAVDIRQVFGLSKYASDKRVSSLNRKYAWNTTYEDKFITKYSEDITKQCDLIRTRKVAQEKNSYNLEKIRL